MLLRTKPPSSPDNFVPDETSNLNPPAPRRAAGNNRRRGRRGGRGRGPRPVVAKPGVTGSEEISPAPEAVETGTPAIETAEHAEHAGDSAGDFREPHAEAPAEFASHETGPEAGHETEPAAETSDAPEPPRTPKPPRESARDRRPENRRPDRRPEPPAQRQWAKPADFRPADTTAISEAVAHATEIAESLKQMIDQLDEVLELVEVAERQKLADEREIEELRRALRRIQPPRREQQPPLPSRDPRRDQPRRDYREQNQRRDEPRQNLPPREQPEKQEEPPASPTTTE